MLIELCEDRYGHLHVTPVNKKLAGKCETLWEAIGYKDTSALFIDRDYIIEEFISELNQRGIKDIMGGWTIVKRINDDVFFHWFANNVLERVNYAPYKEFYMAIDKFIELFGFDPTRG